jgi:hypothetical protein
MLLITIFVELRVVAGRSRTRAGSPQAVSRQPRCVNQMGKTHSKPLAARHGRGTAWARHATRWDKIPSLLSVGHCEGREGRRRVGLG